MSIISNKSGLTNHNSGCCHDWAMTATELSIPQQTLCFCFEGKVTSFLYVPARVCAVEAD